MIVYIYNIGVDLYNGFNGLRHRINWIYFTVLDGLAHPLYSLLSYNNMAKKGSDRSNARISDEDIYKILSKKGDVKVFSEGYKAFTTGKSNRDDNQERLFLCICKEVK